MHNESVSSKNYRILYDEGYRVITALHAVKKSVHLFLKISFLVFPQDWPENGVGQPTNWWLFYYSFPERRFGISTELYSPMTIRKKHLVNKWTQELISSGPQVLNIKEKDSQI